MKTLYIHIGSPKTGTTSIQQTLWNNEEALAAQNTSYPHFEYVYPGRKIQRNGCFVSTPIKEPGKPRDIELERSRRREALDRIHTLFETVDNVIISDEQIWQYGSTEEASTFWSEIKADRDANGYRVVIIAYLRRQIEYAASQWNQRIKVAKSKKTREMDWHRFAADIPRNYGLDYYYILTTAAAYFGHENIVVRRFDRNEFPGGNVTEDFCQIVGLDITKLEQPEIKNLSLDGNAPEIKRIANHYSNNDTPEEKWIRERMHEVSERSKKAYPTKPYTPEEESRIMAEYEDRNKAIEREFLRDGRPLFREEKKEYQTWDPENPHMDDDIIAYATVMNLDLLKRIKELESRVKELEKAQSRMERQMEKQFTAVYNKIGLRTIVKNTVGSITGKKRK